MVQRNEIGSIKLGWPEKVPTWVETADGETWMATPRYRLQVRELAAHELFERCARVLPGFLDAGDR